MMRFVCRFVSFNSFLVEHALYAVKILCCVAQGQSELVGLFTAQTVSASDFTSVRVLFAGQ